MRAVITLSAEEVRRRRSATQLLVDRGSGDARAVVRHLVGVQAQSTPASRLALRARTRDVLAADLRRACDQGELVRTWAMRGTLHMVAAGDVRWITALLGARLAAGDRRRREQLGLDDALVGRALDALQAVLADRGPLPRAETVVELKGRGVDIDPKSQAPAHLLFVAAATGLICRGPDLPDDEPTYVLLDDWVPLASSEEVGRPTVELARRYLGAHAPAGPADFARWSGLPAPAARVAFASLSDETTEVEVDGARCLLPRDTSLPPAGTAPVVRLLPHFDEYLLGFASRDLILAPSSAKRIQAGGGWIHPAVLVDGRVVGRWKMQRRGGGTVVHVEPFEALSPTVHGHIAAEVKDIGRFLGIEATYPRD